MTRYINDEGEDLTENRYLLLESMKVAIKKSWGETADEADKKKYRTFKKYKRKRAIPDQDGLCNVLEAGGILRSENPIQQIKKICKNNGINFINDAANEVIGIKSNVVRLQFDSTFMAERFVNL